MYNINYSFAWIYIEVGPSTVLAPCTGINKQRKHLSGYIFYEISSISDLTACLIWSIIYSWLYHKNNVWSNSLSSYTCESQMYHKALSYIKISKRISFWWRHSNIWWKPILDPAHIKTLFGTNYYPILLQQLSWGINDSQLNKHCSALCIFRLLSYFICFPLTTIGNGFPHKMWGKTIYLYYRYFLYTANSLCL